MSFIMTGVKLFLDYRMYEIRKWKIFRFGLKALFSWMTMFPRFRSVGQYPYIDYKYFLLNLQLLLNNVPLSLQNSSLNLE